MPRRLLVCVATALLCARVAGAQAPFQELDFAAARATALKESKAIFIDFCTVWSGPCRKLDTTTWKDEKVQRWLGEKTIAIKLDAEKSFLLARRYAVREYPTLLLLNSGGLELARWTGSLEPALLLTAAEDALAKSNAHRIARKAQEAAPNDPIARMNWALSLALQGRYAEALDQYVWCYEQGVVNDESFAGLRESILIDEIERLESAYPPAASTIADLAHRIAAQLLEGTGDERDVRDYVALCTRASLKEEMLDLFDRLKEKGAVTVPLRKRLALELTDLLMEQRRYVDLYAHTPDMAQTLARAITQYSNLRSQGERSGAAVEPAQLEQARAQTVSDAGRYFEIALGVGQLSLANRIADKLLSFAPEAQSYELLVRHALRAGASDAARAVAKRADATKTLSALEKSRIKRASFAPPSAH